MIQIQPDEKMVQVVRRHWIVIFSETVPLATLALLPIILVPVLIALNIVALNISNVSFIIFAVSGWLFMLWCFWFVVWTNYYLDAWIITDKKVIDIEQIQLFSREVSEYRLDKIQDITVRTTGLIASWLKFGDVNIQTAGESSEEFIIRHAPHPDQVKNLIMELQHKEDDAVRTVNAVIVNNPSSIQPPSSSQ